MRALSWVLLLVVVGCSGSDKDSDDAVPTDTDTDTDTDSDTDTDTDTDAETADTAPAEPGPPLHVVVVLIDDMGWTGLSGGQTSLGTGSDYYQTPHLDALADESVAFTGALASPNCQPTRAAFLSGQHETRTKVYATEDTTPGDDALRLLDPPLSREHLEPSVVTLPEVLSDAGYRTALVGKWHLGDPTADHGPLAQGFDINIGGSEAGRAPNLSHFADTSGAFDLPRLDANGVSRQFLADRLTDEAISWMAEDLQQPSFLYLSHYSVHAPVMAPPQDITTQQAVPPGVLHDDLTYAAMTYNLDDNLGRLIAFLEDVDDPRAVGDKLIDNTLLVVMSDNGGLGGYLSEGITSPLDFTNAIPLRSGKGSLYEGGVRVPLMVRYDRAGSGGRIVDQRVQHVDLYPTIAEIVGAPLDPTHELDGVSILPRIDTVEQPLAREALFLHFPAYEDFRDVVTTQWRASPSTVVWTDQYKLWYWYEDQRWALYDLSADIGETTDIAAANPDIVLDLGTRMVDWLVATGADLPTLKGTGTVVELPDPATL